MTRDDLKHALISLALGVLVTAITQLVTGSLGILQHWFSGTVGGGSAIVAYLTQVKTA